MDREERLRSEIKKLSANIKQGRYTTDEQNQIALDMLRTKQDELKSITEKSVGSVKNTPINGLVEKPKQTSTKMAGGFKSCI